MMKGISIRNRGCLYHLLEGFPETPRGHTPPHQWNATKTTGKTHGKTTTQKVSYSSYPPEVLAAQNITMICKISDPKTKTQQMSQKRPYVIMPTCRHDSTKDNRSVGHPKKNLWWWLSFRGTIFPPVFRIFGFPQQNPPVFCWDLCISFEGTVLWTYQPINFQGIFVGFHGGGSLFRCNKTYLPQRFCRVC